MKYGLVVPNAWQALRRHTPARIALGRTGSSLPTEEVLAFSLAHARARDAVHVPLDLDRIACGLRSIGFSPQLVRSRAIDRATYLARPDLGRNLDPEARLEGKAEMVIVVADGLSAVAVQTHAIPLVESLTRLAPERWASAGVVIASQARVALGDEVGERLGSKLAVVLIGERPGLSSPDSLGVYLTYEPRVGRTDAERNCVSNVRPAGLPYEAAARRVDWLAAASLARGLSGIALKDESAELPKSV